VYSLRVEKSDWQKNFSTYTSYSCEDDLTEEEVQELRSFDLTIPVRSKNHTLLNDISSLSILMVTWEFPPHLVGGLARHVYDLSRQLAKQGHIIHVITTTLEEAPLYEVIEGVHVHRVTIRDVRSTHFLKWVRELNIKLAVKSLEVLDQFAIHLIHGHDWLVGEAVSTLKAIRKKPLIVTIHATEYGRNEGLHSQTSHLIHEKEQKLVHDADHIIVCSDYMKDEIQSQFLVRGNKIDIIPNGVDPTQFENLDETKMAEDIVGRTFSHLIFSIGRIVNEKGFDMIIDAAPQIIKHYPSAVFVIAGKGPLLEHYKTIVGQLSLDNYIKFVGFVNDQERNDLYKKCHIALFPSMYEPFGIVALEGMANGKPIIVSDTGGLSTIIEDGVSGMKIKPGDVKDLTEKIIYLLDNEEIASSLGANSKEIVKSMYNWHKIAKGTSRLYKELLLSSNE
jgi:glycosyltransferase involved in cell wall biosynthesis